MCAGHSAGWRHTAEVISLENTGRLLIEWLCLFIIKIHPSPTGTHGRLWDKNQHAHLRNEHKGRGVVTTLRACNKETMGQKLTVNYTIYIWDEDSAKVCEELFSLSQIFICIAHIKMNNNNRETLLKQCVCYWPTLQMTSGSFHPQAHRAHTKWQGQSELQGADTASACHLLLSGPGCCPCPGSPAEPPMVSAGHQGTDPLFWA